MKTNRWDDHYTRRARAQKWSARSVYKLQEIDRKTKVIPRSGRILDLGCFPGSWSQFCLSRIGDRGVVVGVDLKKPETRLHPNFRFIQSDVLTLDPEGLAAEWGPVDLVLSDLAPNTTGIAATDVARSMELAGQAVHMAEALLRRNRHFLCKVFEGEGFSDFRARLSPMFKEVRIIRPQATRKRSREVYVVGLKRRSAKA